MSKLPHNPRVFVAGHRGMVGHAVAQELRTQGLLGNSCEVLEQSREDLDLRDSGAVQAYFQRERPDAVVIAAARVGGIQANNTLPVDFLQDNLLIQTNLIQAAHAIGVGRLVFLGSSCIYPRMAPQPIPEEALLTGALEATNEPYAVAKIAGIKLCESYNRQYGTDYRSLMPTNLYGPGDNFHPEHSHVLPALIRRFAEAVRDGLSTVTIWGSGRPRREFLHVQDLAAAVRLALELPREQWEAQVQPMCSHVNVGTGEDIAIADLARLVAAKTGYEGRIEFDTSKPDGTPRKLLNVGRMGRLGWQAQISLDQGLEQTLSWYQEHAASVRGQEVSQA